MAAITTPPSPPTMLVVKNGFLEVVDTDRVGSARRTRSAPPVLKLTSQWSTSEDMNNDKSCRTSRVRYMLLERQMGAPERPDVGVEGPLDRFGHAFAPQPMKKDTAVCEDVASTSVGSTRECLQDPPSRQKKNRHCKTKRDRYRRLLARLTQLATNDRDAFLNEMVNLPTSIGDCEKSKKMLLTTLQTMTQIRLLP
mmetsp:Transcript_126597/g.405274  ORF Transcript_126597/g.405274 Transcript_126597/m.405274 type:complete len:196 (+) Transcript_126597:83-670(+)|eukprot:CAMPEP_0204170420 /NCGR_PEP_ID=MMETSP0361-20130328/42378_1 /ASSEMBLY_ACC=CAM_ASM_000343 /TAXON_ID=268821 /ORGANISM="Scrippsiella Hangoei, Strain SHTV-5" /LENGTH=195 /DNA_ID=CAMNT_0051128149 /DNA_START=29 /DNA_END=616 /DNA_ORIENTATION=+